LVALAFLVSPASGAQYEFVLYTDGSPVFYCLNGIGPNVYSVNGQLFVGDKYIAITGTCVVEGPNARFGLTLQNAMLGYAPVVWEFVINIGTMSGSGNYVWLTGDETSGTLTVSPTATEASVGDMRAFGAN
jgi:hypothetical protein